MYLHRYFKTQGHQLTNPSEPLSSSVPSAAIEEDNAAVTAVNKSHSSSATCIHVTKQRIDARHLHALMLDTLFDAHAYAVRGK